MVRPFDPPRTQRRPVSFPPGITVKRENSPQGGQRVSDPCPLLPSPVLHQRQKKELPPPASPRCGAPLRWTRGTGKPQPRFTLSQRTREIPVVLCLTQRFGEVSDHNGEGSAL